jgi:uncharacterized OB-fold protein
VYNTIPKPTKASAPFWRACRNHVLELQRCARCGTYAYFPVYACPNCWSSELEWTAVSGRGRVYSRTVVSDPVSAAVSTRGPLVVALIELDEGPVMMSNIVGPGAEDVAIGAAVKVTFVDIDAEIALPVFERA